MGELQSVDSLLAQAVALGASDLHLTAATPPVARVHGDLVALDGCPTLDADTTRSLLYRVLTTEQQKRLEIDRQLDLSYGVPGLSRFRVNVYMQRESLAAAFRVVPHELKSLDELGLPAGLKTFAELPRGLVLVTGPTGSGKSTTLAALIDEINLHAFTITSSRSRIRSSFIHRHLLQERQPTRDRH